MNSLILSARITKVLNIPTPPDALYGIVDNPDPLLVSFLMRHIDAVCKRRGFDEVDINLFEHEEMFKYMEVFCICCDSTLMLEVEDEQEAKNMIHLFNEATRHVAFRLANRIGEDDEAEIHIANHTEGDDDDDN